MKTWLYENYVVITGASGGIGRQLCKIFVQKYKAKVVGVARNEEKLRSLQEELGESFSYCVFDVSVRENWNILKTYLVGNNVSPVLFVNNAGEIPPFCYALDLPVETYERVMQTNYFSCVYGVETIAPLMKKAGKKLPFIANVSSSAGLCPVVGTTAYSASKFAVRGYTEALGLDLKGKIKVGVICPGTTATDLFKKDEQTEGSALYIIAMSTEKMSKKIARRLRFRKRRSAVGWDSKIMGFLARLMPVKGPFAVRKVMKISKSKVFKNVFKEE